MLVEFIAFTIIGAIICVVGFVWDKLSGSGKPTNEHKRELEGLKQEVDSNKK